MLSLDCVDLSTLIWCIFCTRLSREEIGINIIVYLVVKETHGVCVFLPCALGSCCHSSALLAFLSDLYARRFCAHLVCAKHLCWGNSPPHVLLCILLSEYYAAVSIFLTLHIFCIASTVFIVTANLIICEVKMLFANPLQIINKYIFVLEWVNKVLLAYDIKIYFN